jgi:hypothetical protein
MAAELSRAQRIAQAYPRMASYADLIVETSGRLGIDPAWLANIIQLESGGNPQARNPTSRATGLIQFMPCPTCTAEGLGTTVDALYQMNGRQQMPYVERYFQNTIRARGPLRSQEDVIGAVFYPAHIGKPDKEFPAIVQQQNAGLRTLRDYAQRLAVRAKLPIEGIGISDVGALAANYWWLLVIGAAGVAGALIWRRRQAEGG